MWESENHGMRTGESEKESTVTVTWCAVRVTCQSSQGNTGSWCAPGCQHVATKVSSWRGLGNSLPLWNWLVLGIRHLQPTAKHLVVSLRLLVGKHGWTAGAPGGQHRAAGLIRSLQSGSWLSAPPPRVRPLLHTHFPNLTQAPLRAVLRTVWGRKSWEMFPAWLTWGFQPQTLCIW